MAEKKRQHFIPCFYLRNFATENSSKIIGLLNIKSRRYISDAKLKTQAYKDYFYSSDLEIENALADIEGHASRIITNAIEKQLLPIWNSDNHHILLSFVVLLSLRTVYAVDLINEMADKYVKSLVIDDTYINHLDMIKVSLTEPALLNLKLSESMIQLASDLGYVLFCNNTERSFITSDNPVVLYNQFLEARKTYGSNTGWGSKGLQVFLPISPRYLLVFYDRDVYGIHHLKNWLINVTNFKDIDALNTLQCIAANENIYFGSEVKETYVNDLFDFGLQRRTCRANVDIFDSVPLKNEQNSSLILSYREDINCNLKLSSMFIRNKAKRYQLGNRVVHIRNPQLRDSIRKSRKT